MRARNALFIRRYNASEAEYMVALKVPRKIGISTLFNTPIVQNQYLF